MWSTIWGCLTNFSIGPQTKLCGWLLWQIPPIWKVYNFFVFYTVEILLCNAKPHQQKSLLILNFQFLIFFFKYYCCIQVRQVWFHKLANHNEELQPWHWKLIWTFFANLFWLFSWIIFNYFWAFVHANLSPLCLEF